MKKKSIGWLIGSAAVMLLLPWAAVTFAPCNSGMAVALLLFFAIDPIYSIILGIFAGKHIKEMWSLPVMAAALFLLGACIFFDPVHWHRLDAVLFTAQREKTAVI